MWFNGKFDSFDGDAKRLANDRGFLLGDGVFETILAENGQAHWLALHYHRLSNSLKELAMRVDYRLDDIQTACDTLIEHNKNERLVLRLTVSRGAGGRGLDMANDQPESWLLTAAPAPAVPDSLSCITTPILRPSTNLSSRIKTIGYIDNMLARRHALNARADEGLMLNEKGHIACAAAGNIFVQNGNTLQTPPIEDGVLAGVMRGVLLERASRLNLEPETASLTEADLAKADYVFITNSLIGAVPVTKLNDCPKEKSPAMQAISNLMKP